MEDSTETTETPNRLATLFRRASVATLAVADIMTGREELRAESVDTARHHAVEARGMLNEAEAQFQLFIAMVEAEDFEKLTEKRLSKFAEMLRTASYQLSYVQRELAELEAGVQS